MESTKSFRSDCSLTKRVPVVTSIMIPYGNPASIENREPTPKPSSSREAQGPSCMFESCTGVAPARIADMRLSAVAP